eukprot:m.37172 g.37172  ORF g.37172 m.37172 type:complete len:235 (+) comp32338_c0_seq2:2575-3279(+)
MMAHSDEFEPNRISSSQWPCPEGTRTEAEVVQTFIYTKHSAIKALHQESIRQFSSDLPSRTAHRPPPPRGSSNHKKNDGPARDNDSIWNGRSPPLQSMPPPSRRPLSIHSLSPATLVRLATSRLSATVVVCSNNKASFAHDLRHLERCLVVVVLVVVVTRFSCCRHLATNSNRRLIQQSTLFLSSWPATGFHTNQAHTHQSPSFFTRWPPSDDCSGDDPAWLCIYPSSVATVQL